MCCQLELGNPSEAHQTYNLGYGIPSKSETGLFEGCRRRILARAFLRFLSAHVWIWALVASPKAVGCATSRGFAIGLMLKALPPGRPSAGLLVEYSAVYTPAWLLRAEYRLRSRGSPEVGPKQQETSSTAGCCK